MQHPAPQVDQAEPGGAPATVMTPDPGDDAHAAHRALRLRRIKLAIVGSVIVRPLGVIIPLITVPLFLKYLGRERYALFELIGALAMWLALSDAGLAAGLVNRLQTCHVKGDEALARKYVSSLSVALAAIVLVITVLLSIAVPLIPWQKVFETHDPLARLEMPWAVWIAGVLTLLGSMSNISSVIYNAYQEQHRYAFWDGLSRVLTLGCCLATVHTRLGLIGVLLAAYGMAVLVRLVNVIVLVCYEKPHLRPSLALFDIRLVRIALGDGIYMFVLQFAVMAIFQSDKLVIGTLLNPKDVVPFSVVGRSFIIGYGIFIMLLSPLWPAYGEAIRRGDIAWMRRGVRIATTVGCGGILLWGTFLLVAGKWIFPLWTREPGMVIPHSLVLAMTATFALRAWVDSRTIALNSVAIYKPQIFFFGAHAILNLGLALLLAKPFGPVGVAWATPIAALLTSAWGYPWLMNKFLYSGAVRSTLV
jgi:O-antigen/teichoic acid export membrane protein